MPMTQALYGDADVDETTVVRTWFAPPSDRACSSPSGTGGLVGYADVQREGERDRSRIDVRALRRPDGDAARCSCAAPRRGRASAPPPARRRVRSGRARTSAPRGRRAAGLPAVRHSYRMEIVLRRRSTEPVWPDGIVAAHVRPRARRARGLRGAQEAFADHWDHAGRAARRGAHWSIADPRFDPTCGSSREDGDELAGISLCDVGTSPATRPRAGSACSACAGRGGGAGSALALLLHSFRDFAAAGARASASASTRRTSTGAVRLYERAGMHVDAAPETAARGAVSRLRARCPDCRTLTAVAVGPDYECHSCGREFGAGLVRVPRAWGTGGEAMAEAALHELPYPEAAVVEADTLAEQNAAARRPTCPTGRSCSAGAAARTSARSRRSQRARGLPRGRLDRRARRPEHARDVAVRQRLGNAAADGDRRRRRRAGARRARRRAQPRPAGGRVHRRERHPHGRRRDRAALAGADAVYVALDPDSVEPGELAVFMPGAGRPPPRRGRGAARRRRRADADRRHSASPDCCATRPTSPSSHASPAPLGL